MHAIGSETVQFVRKLLGGGPGRRPQYCGTMPQRAAPPAPLRGAPATKMSSRASRGERKMCARRSPLGMGPTTGVRGPPSVLHAVVGARRCNVESSDDSRPVLEECADIEWTRYFV